ncbi:MAG: hypothetical protein AAFY29_21915 [Pseudomonadota bacterium]
MIRLLLSLFALLPALGFAEPLFDNRDVLTLELRAPFKLIDRERDKDKEYEGSLSYEDPALGPTTLQAKFSVRGNFRLRKDICGHAQLWVNLKKGELKGTLFAGQNKLKLVVQCRDAARYAEYLARERQAYLMFEELSELSLATRAVKASFVDSDGGNSREQMAFFIQHQKRLAASWDMDVFKEERGDRARLDPGQSALVSLYMYLLSNTDYSLIAAAPGETCCHNIKLLVDGNGTLFPVPYDYDSTGFVNTSYAQPAGGIGQEDVRDRVYRGYCLPEEQVLAAVALLQEKKDDIYAIISADAQIPERSIKRTRKYVDKFYAVLDNPKKLKREIVEGCR